MNQLARTLLPLLLMLLALVVLSAFIKNDSLILSFYDRSLPIPSIPVSMEEVGEVSSASNRAISFTLDGTSPGLNSTGELTIAALTEPYMANAPWAFPTGIQWSHPVGQVHQALMLKARYVNGDGLGPIATRTFIGRGHQLPVISIVAPAATFFDSDSGLYVMGHEILKNDPKLTRRFARDGSWWKYPGNFQGRGKKWERTANIEFLTADGSELMNTAVKVRVNGQNSRGFPIRSLRLLFPVPVTSDLFNEKIGSGYAALVLRSSGNDYKRAMMRDAIQHQLCSSLPFATSAAQPVILYLSGTYWGIHHLRQRMDDDELARRYSIPAEKVNILEDAAMVYRGPESERESFLQFLTKTEKTAGQHPAELKVTVVEALDLQGFLEYMSAQIILGNRDWPAQNLKFWRYGGEYVSGKPVTDGKWRMIMGDSDMGLGFVDGNAASSYDMFKHIQRHSSPIARLFNALMLSEEIRGDLNTICQRQVNGPLSADTMLAVINENALRLTPELAEHVDRWRRPASTTQWQDEVNLLRSFAIARGPFVLDQLGQIQQQYSGS